MIKQISIQFRTPTDLLLKLVGKLWTIIRGDGKEIGKNPVVSCLHDPPIERIIFDLEGIRFWPVNPFYREHLLLTDILSAASDEPQKQGQDQEKKSDICIIPHLSIFQHNRRIEGIAAEVFAV